MRPANRLTYSVAIVMASTLLSRLIGFVREMLLPNMLALGAETDAYNNAFILPDLMYSLLLGGAVSAAMIPALSGFIDTEREGDGWHVISNFINTILILMLLLCAAGMIFSGELMSLLISGEDREQTRLLASRISTVLFPSIAFLMMSGILNGVLNSYRRFAAAALGPIAYNIGSALSIYFLSKNGPVSIAYGVLASAFIYFLIVLFFTRKELRYYRPVLSFADKSTRRLFSIALPSFLSASVVQLNIIVSMKFANFFQEGRVSAFKLADRTWQMPYGIIAVSLGIALLPTLSGIYARREIKEFARITEKSLKYMFTIILPCAAAFIVLSGRIVSALFRFTEKMSAADAEIISGILFIFSAALLFQSAVAILNRVYYAMQETRIPLYTGICAIAVNLLLSYVFRTYTSLDIDGIALAYSISSFINLFLLAIILKRKLREIMYANLGKYIVKLLPALTAMTVVMFVLGLKVPGGGNGTDAVTKITQFASLSAILAAGVGAYMGLILLMKVPEGIEAFNKICIKFKLKRLEINVNK